MRMKLGKDGLHCLDRGLNRGLNRGQRVICVRHRGFRKSSWLPLLLLFAMGDGLARATQPAQAQAAPAAMTFDIPSESLADALGIYTSMTGVEVFSPNGMMAGRH